MQKCLQEEQETEMSDRDLHEAQHLKTQAATSRHTSLQDKKATEK
jgi:hypothetical protein